MVKGHGEDGGGALDQDVFLVFAGQVSEAVHQEVADVVHVTNKLGIIGPEAVDGGLGGGQGDEVAAGGSCVHDPTLCNRLHDLSLAGDCGEGESTGRSLGQRCKVGGDSEELLSAADGESEASDYLVEDKQDAVFVAELADAFQVAGVREGAVGVHRDRFHDDGGDLVGVLADCVGYYIQVIPGEERLPPRRSPGTGRGTRGRGGGSRRGPRPGRWVRRCRGRGRPIHGSGPRT